MFWLQEEAEPADPQTDQPSGEKEKDREVNMRKIKINQKYQRGNCCVPALAARTSETANTNTKKPPPRIAREILKAFA